MIARSFLIPIVLALGSPFAFAQYGYDNHTTTTQPTLASARINDEGQLVVKHIIAKPVHETQTRTITVTKTKEEQRIREEKKIQDGKEVVVQVPYTVAVPYQVTQEVEVMATKAVPTEERMTYSYNSHSKQYHVDDGGQPALFYETNGKTVPAADIASRLTDWQPIVVSFDGQTVPDYYTYVFKPGTLVASLPRPMPKPVIQGPSALPQPGVPIPMPQPPPKAPEAPMEDAPKPKPANVAETESAFSVAFQQNEEVQMPTSFPPTFAFAKITDNQIALRTIREVTRKQTVANLKAPTQNQNGEAQSFPARIELQNVVRTHDIWQMALDKVEGMTGSGQKLKGQDLPAKLPREATVLITKGGRKADEFWLKSLRPETLILTTPIPQESIFQFGHGGGSYHYAPMPMPPRDESAPAVPPGSPV